MRRRTIYAEKNKPPAARVDKHTCPKCGKVCVRGLHVHVKYCKNG